jgi:hypothetical protein
MSSPKTERIQSAPCRAGIGNAGPDLKVENSGKGRMKKEDFRYTGTK